MSVFSCHLAYPLIRISALDDSDIQILKTYVCASFFAYSWVLNEAIGTRTICRAIEED